jgi:hypothetical protein
MPSVQNCSRPCRLDESLEVSNGSRLRWPKYRSGGRSLVRATTVQIDGSGWRLGTEPFLAYAASSAFRSLMNRYQAFVSLPSATHRAARCIGHSGKDLALSDSCPPPLQRPRPCLSTLVSPRRQRVGEPVGLRFLQSSSRAIATRLNKMAGGSLNKLAGGSVELGGCSSCFSKGSANG